MNPTPSNNKAKSPHPRALYIASGVYVALLLFSAGRLAYRPWLTISLMAAALVIRHTAPTLAIRIVAFVAFLLPCGTLAEDVVNHYLNPYVPSLEAVKEQSEFDRIFSKPPHSPTPATPGAAPAP